MFKKSYHVKLDEKVKHHTKETEFNKRLIVHFLNSMMKNEKPFASIFLNIEVMKDLHEKVEYHNKQKELYWEMHQAVAKGKTEEEMSGNAKGSNWNPSENTKGGSNLK